ncbi:hypothetical protein SAMD00019534_104830 [Acytostelium subglobosum LB1]|uniref:hypothetical protein n=1 Tax=Acytostelium subglobosum LB1 TaxID=1410327 RepID=UPI000644C4B5|nr:hypothetical protein SAMD00019534_104830 [Acytostelium subglobosum LB1]GAM27308.1 hypothetical protein SAMD00019534_104830 [Acytostelium subglobosum LB1]|eukprot:XP_012749775.1 hypothetical protein SAMD00019534_104830 [Acytostelium subglobosum LB1]
MILNMLAVVAVVFATTTSVSAMTTMNVGSTASTANSYVAAIVEYSPIAYAFPNNVTQDIAVQYMLQNVMQYKQFITQAVEQKAQIIVFPEYGITGNNFANSRDRAFSFMETVPYPDPFNPIIPCDNTDTPILNALSCMALANKIVVVVNMADVQYCNTTNDVNCPSDGRYQFNTQVAFGSNGAIIGRYHKSHLYRGEAPVMDQPIVPDIEMFTTDFNVTFGMMICFDILFEEPQSTLVAAGVNNFVYSTEWVNGNYAYARQIQQAMSYNSRSNVLASNIGSINMMSGSGIFSNGQPMATFFNPTFSPQSHLVVATVPSDPSSVQAQQLSTFYSEPLCSDDQPPKVNMRPNYSGVPPNTFNSSFTIFKPSSHQSNIALQSENNGFVCNLKYSTKEVPGDQHFAVVSFNGFFNGHWNAQICMVAICLDDTEAGCSQLVFKSKTVFTDFEMSAAISEGYNVNAMIYSENVMSNYYQSYDPNTYTFAITGMNDPMISASMFAQQWTNVTMTTISASTFSAKPFTSTFLVR